MHTSSQARVDEGPQTESSRVHPADEIILLPSAVDGTPSLTSHFAPRTSPDIHLSSLHTAEVVGSSPAAPTAGVFTEGLVHYHRRV